MRFFYALATTLLLAACNTAPQILSDKNNDSVIIKKLNHEITHGGSGNNWGWVLWYFPIVVLIFAWAWKEWVRPSINALENEDSDKIKETGIDPNKTDSTQNQS